MRTASNALSVLCLVFVVASGCVSVTPPQTYPQPEPVIVDAPADSLWPAIVDVVNERQLVIKTIDRPSGLLQSERMWTSGSAFWDCGTQVTGVQGNQTLVAVADIQGVPVVVTISAVPQGAQQTRVRVTGNPGQTVTASGLTNTFVQCTSKGVFEASLLEAIRSRWAELRR